MNLQERIQEERNRVSEEVEQLKGENAIDAKLFNELQQEYSAAVVFSNETEIDKVNFQIKEVRSRITRRNEKLEAYNDKNNPVIQKMISEDVTKWYNEICILEEQAAEKEKALQPLKEELLNGLLEMEKVRHRANSLRDVINYWKRELNENNRQKMGLPEYNFSGGESISTNMQRLLIQSGDVFKR